MTEYNTINSYFLEINQTRTENLEFCNRLTISKDHLLEEKANLEKNLNNMLKENQNLGLINQDLVKRMMQIKEEQMIKMNEMYDLEQALKNKEEMLPDYEIIADEPEWKCDGLAFKSIKPPRRRTLSTQGHEVEGTILVHNSSGTSFLTSGNESVIKIWDSYSCLQKQSLKGFLQAILCISVSPLDDIVLGGSSNFMAYVWHSSSTKLRHSLTGHCGKVTGVGFLRSNIDAVTSSEDKTLKI